MRTSRRTPVWTRRLRSPLVAAGAAGVLLVLGIAALASVSGKPEPLRDLERAEQAGESVRRSSADLVADLDRISENLEAGFDLRETTGSIHALTEKQVASLDEVARLLRKQISELERTLSQLRGTRSTADSIEGLSAEQSQILARTIDTLKKLRTMARLSSATSADLAVAARYGARLAEDSRRAFATP
jgi:DNA-binding transcriptional MerR regulator